LVRSRLWIAFAVAALAALPAAAADTTFDGQVQAGGLVDLAGTLAGTASLRHLLLAEGVGEVLSLEGDLSVEFVEERTVLDLAPADQRLPSEPVAAHSVQVVAGPETTLLLTSDDLAGTLDPATSSLRLKPYADGALATRFVPTPDPWAVMPNGGCGVSEGAPAALAGPLRMLVHAASLTVDGQPRATGTAGNAATRTVTFAVVTASHANVALAPAAWRSCTHAWDLQVHGTLLVQDVRYAADLGPGYVAGDEARFAAEGDLRLQGRHEGSSSLWRIQGTVASVTAGDAKVWAATAAVATAAAGAGALGVLAWLLAALRAQPFDNGNRVRILERIREAPGITIQALHEASGVGTTTVRFHLRVLSREGLVQSYRQGIREHYVASGAAGSRLHRVRAALLQHPARARIHAVLAASHGPLDYAAFARHWAQRGEEALSRPLTEYHLKLLAQQGLVERVMPGARWRLAPEQPGPPHLATVPAPAAAGVPA
jgi:DNA-binding transcriptional ArsR family regulator